MLADPPQQPWVSLEQIVPALDELDQQLVRAQRHVLQVGTDPGERHHLRGAVVCCENPVVLLAQTAVEVGVAELADWPRVQDGRGVDDAEVLVVEELRPERVEPPPPAGRRLVKGRKQLLQRHAAEARGEDLDEPDPAREEVAVSHDDVVAVVGVLPQRGREQLQRQRRGRLEDRADRALAGQDVVVGKPDVVVLAPAVPLVEQRTQPSPLGTRDDIADDAVRSVCGGISWNGHR
ncbi:MAG: hypothetical protein LC789_03570 [Actinobacteria bacterium]|nr:hypothetical protein [Actinomycetota bacterium]MCA1722416.1 hypothetical protein [Actinomycetota bacterium]